MKLSFKQKQKIVDYFRERPEVMGVYLYGSQTTNMAGPLSDVDIAVVLSAADKDKYFDFQLKYINEIQSILEIDLAADVKILSGEQPLIYLREVICDGELIVVNNPQEIKRFSDRVAMLYPDFYPVLQNYYSQMQKRLREGTYAAGY